MPSKAILLMLLVYSQDQTSHRLEMNTTIHLADTGNAYAILLSTPLSEFGRYQNLFDKMLFLQLD